MSLFNAYTRLSGSVDATIAQDERLDRHMPLKGHGYPNVCDLYIVVNDYKALLTTLDILESEDIPWHIIGKGTSFIPVEVPYHGALIELGAEFKKIEFDPQSGAVSAGAACKLNHVVMACAGEGVKYLECLAGIPGTVGGATYLNVAYDNVFHNHWSHSKSGIFNETIFYPVSKKQHYIQYVDHIIRHIESIVIYNPQTHKLDKLFFQDLYNKQTARGATLSLPEGAVILEVRFKTTYADPIEESDTDKLPSAKSRLNRYNDSVADCTDSIIRHALSQQPPAMSRCIYPFNTTTATEDMHPIGYIITSCFPDGVENRGAYVDMQYPEYVVNESNSDAHEVYKCIKHIQKEVKEVYGIELEPKITLLGISSKAL